jgi:RND family efflux transporter MFP subunit
MKRFLATACLFLAAVILAAWAGYNYRQFGKSAVLSAQTMGPAPANATERTAVATAIDDTRPGKKIKYWVAPMDPTYIRHEPGKSPMGMDLVPVYEEEGEADMSASTIRIDPITIQNMGVRLAAVQRKPLDKKIRTFGNITYDETKFYAVNTKFSGWIEKLYVNFEGTYVRKGEPLFDIYSPELVTAQEEYLLALKQYSSLAASAYATVRESSQRLRDASLTRLRYWDLTEQQINELEQLGTPRKLLTVFSPADGVVMKKKALEGHRVTAGEDLYEIADLDRIWVDVDIYEYELPWVKPGMAAEMELAYVPGRRFYGKVLYVYPYLNSQTRTATLRLEFPNPDHQLKPNMHANIYLSAQIDQDNLVIPQEAVIDSGVRKIIFVALGQGKFEPREVQLGVEVNDTEYQVLGGLQEGEQVVVSAQFMLDSESRLREAIQKMLQAGLTGGVPAATGASGSPDNDLDMRGLTMEDMDDDLDLTNISMEDDPATHPTYQ